MRDDLAVTDLVTRAQDGDQQAWYALVERYAPLIWSICRRYRLGCHHHPARMLPGAARRAAAAGRLASARR
jgi:Helix-turn-helix domain